VPETWPPVCAVLTRDLDWTEDEELPAWDLVGGKLPIEEEDDDATTLLNEEAATLLAEVLDCALPAVLTACALLDEEELADEELADEELADEAAPGCDLVGGRLEAAEAEDEDEDDTEEAAAGAAGAEETADELLDCALDWELLTLLKMLELELELLADVLAVDEAQESMKHWWLA